MDPRRMCLLVFVGPSDVLVYFIFSKIVSISWWIKRSMKAYLMYFLLKSCSDAVLRSKVSIFHQQS